MDALITHPLFGSLWLSNCRIIEVDGKKIVVGDADDTTDVGSPYMPDDYRGQRVAMSFPVSCVRKWRS